MRWTAVPWWSRSGTQRGGGPTVRTAHITAVERHIAARSHAGLDEFGLFQLFQRPAHGAAGHLVLFGQTRFGHDPLPRLERAVSDLLGKLVPQVLRSGVGSHLQPPDDIETNIEQLCTG